MVKADAKQYMKSLAAIPATYKNSTYGTIILCFKKTHTFTAEEETLCKALGNSTAQAITINRLNSKIRRAKSHLELTVKKRTGELVQANEILNLQITERKEAEKKLRNSQHFIEQIANVVPGIIAVYDIPSDRYIYTNNTSEKILGYPKEAFLGQTFSAVTQLIHPHDLPKVLIQNNAALETANQIHNKDQDVDPIVLFEYRMRHNDGSWRWLNTYSIVFGLSPQGHVRQILNISVDITDRKLIEQELQRDRAKDEALLSSIGEGILAVNSAGQVILVNPPGEIISGQTKGELLGQVLHNVQLLYDEQGREIPITQRPTYQVLHQHYQNKAPLEHRVYYKQKNGTLVPAAVTVTPVIFEGTIIGAIQIFRDITKEMEIDKAKSELISLASHQLRTPLSAINWYSESLAFRRFRQT